MGFEKLVVETRKGVLAAIVRSMTSAEFLDFPEGDFLKTSSDGSGMSGSCFGTVRGKQWFGISVWGRIGHILFSHPTAKRFPTGM